MRLKERVERLEKNNIPDHRITMSISRLGPLEGCNDINLAGLFTLLLEKLDLELTLEANNGNYILKKRG